jgi:MinD-like ATPase involved in chromosome partitioning or flagellar assembly
MSTEPAVIVHTADTALARGLAASLAGVTVLHASGGDDLGRLLTSDRPVAALVLHLPAGSDTERGWRRISLIRGEMPDVAILAYLDANVQGWDPTDGPCPASAVVRGPIGPGDLARATRVAGRFGPGADQAAGGTGPRPIRSRAVIGLAGGVGVTTIAALLGVRLAVDQHTVLVDLDQRHGALAGTLRVTPRYTTYDLANAFDSPARLDEAMPSVLTPVRDRLQLLAARDEPDVLVARSGAGDASTLIELVRASNRLEAQVVVDLGDLPLATYAVLAEVDEVVVVVAHDIRCVRRLPMALAQLQDRAPDAIVRTVLNRSASGMDPSARQLANLVERSWDVVLGELPAIQVAQNDTARDGLLGFATAAPRPIELLTRSLLDLEQPTRVGRSGGWRRSRSTGPSAQTGVPAGIGGGS